MVILKTPGLLKSLRSGLAAACRQASAEIYLTLHNRNCGMSQFENVFIFPLISLIFSLIAQIRVNNSAESACISSGFISARP